MGLVDGRLGMRRGPCTSVGVSISILVAARRRSGTQVNSPAPPPCPRRGRGEPEAFSSRARWTGHRAGDQHGHGALARRRTDREGGVRGRPNGARGRSARADRSGTLSGNAQPGHGQAGAGSSQPATPTGSGAHAVLSKQGNATQQLLDQRTASVASLTAQVQATRQRSTALRFSSPIPPSVRRWRDAPAFVSSTRQHRARQRPGRHADDHPASADLGGVHSSGAGSSGHQRRAEVGPVESDGPHLRRRRGSSAKAR